METFDYKARRIEFHLGVEALWFLRDAEANTKELAIFAEIAFLFLKSI